MKRLLSMFVAAAFFTVGSMALASDHYQVTGPVVDIKDDVIVVKKDKDNWEIHRDKSTKTSGEIKKGDRVMIKYRMTASSIESKETKGKTKGDDKKKAEAKTK